MNERESLNCAFIIVLSAFIFFLVSFHQSPNEGTGEFSRKQEVLFLFQIHDNVIKC